MIKFKIKLFKRITFYNDKMIAKNVFFFLHLAIPEVSVTYSTIWNFTDIIPYFCGNISTHLNTSTPILEETFVNQCQNLIIHRSVKIAFSTLAFTVSFSVYFSAQFLVGHKKDGILNHNYWLSHACVQFLVHGEFFSEICIIEDYSQKAFSRQFQKVFCLWNELNKLCLLCSYTRQIYRYLFVYHGHVHICDYKPDLCECYSFLIPVVCFLFFRL